MSDRCDIKFKDQLCNQIGQEPNVEKEKGRIYNEQNKIFTKRTHKMEYRKAKGATEEYKWQKGMKDKRKNANY